MRRAVTAVILAILCAAGLPAQARRFTLLHTNDLHSHLQGVSPELDYTPLTPGDDATLGGWSRLAAAIQAVRRDRHNPVLVLDAGDFLMGSLFHMVAREDALELGLLAAMGYDAVSPGNHELDLMPDGLARILSAARRGGLVQRYRVLERGGVRFGLQRR